MENNNQLDELLVKHLMDGLSEEEELLVVGWINASEENRRYFESLKNTWQLAAVKQTDEVNVDKEWDHFRQTIAAKEAKVISMNEQEQWEGEYLKEESPAGKPVVYKLLISAAIAASVLLVVGLGWKFFFNNKEETHVAQNTGGKTDSLLFVVRHEVNTTGKEKRIQLPDGSMIMLADKSEITYHEPFIDKRDITLIGKANFKVAKDKTRPFTVISDDIATTALGTEFTVTAFAQASQITVRLYEGKVVVRTLERGNWRMKNDLYLSPGQELVYSDKELAYVRAFNRNKAATQKSSSKELSRDNPSIPEDTKGPWFMFNNQSLEQVLDNLAAMYEVKIIYAKKDVQNINWTGQYYKSDSLETILKRIAIVHNLTVTKRDTAYIISK